MVENVVDALAADDRLARVAAAKQGGKGVGGADVAVVRCDDEICPAPQSDWATLVACPS